MKLQELEENQCFHFSHETKVRQVAAIVGDKYVCPILGEFREPLQNALRGSSAFNIEKSKDVILLDVDQKLFTYRNGADNIFQVSINDLHDVQDFFLQLNAREDNFTFVSNQEFQFEEEKDAQYVVKSNDGSREIGVLFHKEPGLI